MKRRNMKRTIHFIFMLCAFATLYGCHGGSNESLKEDVEKEIARLKKDYKEDALGYDLHLTSIYEPEEGYINRRDRLFQDFKLNPGIGENGVCFSAYFYNYGGDIKLFNGFVNDCFVPAFGHIQGMAHIEDMHTLRIKRTRVDDKYGSYAIVDWTAGNGMTISDIYMTPMAYHGYRTRNDENLIFVQIIGGDKYLNIIVCGDYFERIMVDHSPNAIEDGLFPGAGKSGHGQFWQLISK